MKFYFGIYLRTIFFTRTSWFKRISKSFVNADSLSGVILIYLDNDQNLAFSQRSYFTRAFGRKSASGLMQLLFIVK